MKQDSDPKETPESPERGRKGFINFSAAKVKQKIQIAAGAVRLVSLNCFSVRTETFGNIEDDQQSLNIEDDQQSLNIEIKQN